MALLEEIQVLVADLEAAFAGRTGAEIERLAQAARDARERAADVATTLDGFHRERVAQTVSDARARAEAERDRLAQAAREARERAADVAVRRGEVATTLDGFHRERVAQTASDARARDEAEQERRAAAAEDSRERAAEVAVRRGEVATTLDGFHRERVAQTARDARARDEAEQERRAAAAEDSRERVADVRAAGEVWHEHTAAMAGRQHRASARRKQAYRKPAHGKAAKRISAAAIAGYLADRPGGARLADLEAHFGAGRAVLARSLSDLTEANRVRRDGKSKRYFLVE